MDTPLLLEMTAGAAPDRLALGRLSERISFDELHARCLGAAAFLAEQPGNNIVFVGLNGPTLPVALIASGMLGKPFVPLNYRLPDSDLMKLLVRTSPSIAIVDDDMVSRLTPIQDVMLLSRSAFERESSTPSRRAKSPPDVEADVALLLFTSGTTGEPKAAVLRHRNLTAYVTSSVQFLSAGEEEAALICVPPYHIAGIAAILTGVYSGRRLVHLSEFTAAAWVNDAISEKITHAMVVPTMLGRILDVLEKSGENLPCMRTISYGGGPMPRAVIERAINLLPHVDFANGYGLTETSSTIAVLGPQDHREAIGSLDDDVRRRLSSVGRPLPSVEVQIRNTGGNVVAPGEVGEIYVRGEQVSGEYSHKSVLLDDGWFATNDSGWMDQQGYLYLEGRLDDVIVRGGENISPGEIEDVLRMHPSVVDAAVFGVPDDEWGERVAAVIVIRGEPPSTTVLASWVRERLRSTKSPEVWEFRSELPYNDLGKLLRRQLRSEMVAKA